jgi:hypothetical protein
VSYFSVVAFSTMTIENAIKLNRLHALYLRSQPKAAGSRAWAVRANRRLHAWATAMVSMKVIRES